MWPTKSQQADFLSANNMSTYNLSNIFLLLLKFLTTNEYNVKNSFSFVDNLCKNNNDDNLKLPSFDSLLKYPKNNRY